MINISFTAINIRLFLSLLIGISIGYERKTKGHSAGIRTNVLVCLGACIISLIQLTATNQVLEIASKYPETGNVLSTDITRVIAQIVSGIGFLGAGTIMVTNRKKISGLTSAASIWSVASLGIATGMGYYYLAILGTGIILLVLSVLKKTFKEKFTYVVKLQTADYTHTNINILKYIDRKNLFLIDLEYKKKTEDNREIYQLCYFIQSFDLLEVSTMIQQLIHACQLIESIKIERL